MAQTFPSLAAVIDGHRTRTSRTYRNLADETLIPLTTLHRKMQTGEFTPTELHRIALAFDTKPSKLLEEAGQ